MNYVMKNTEKNKRLALIITILGIVFGLHASVDGRGKKEVLYLITALVFILGWMVGVLKLFASKALG